MLSASLTVETAGPSENSKLMPSRIRQKDLNSFMDIEKTRLLVEGNSSRPSSAPNLTSGSLLLTSRYSTCKKKKKGGGGGGGGINSTISYQNDNRIKNLEVFQSLLGCP